MTSNISDFDFPDWKVLHIYQEGNETNQLSSTILLLHHKESIGEHYAIGKIVTIPSDRGSDRCVNEAIALAKIPLHTGIIKLYSTHVDVPRPMQVSLILEFCAGEDLRALSDHAWCIGRCIPEDFVWHVLYQALVALEHLDRNHISHGDVHCGNMLLRPVEGDAYPDIVLADLEFCEDLSPNKWDKRSDFVALASMIDCELLILGSRGLSDGEAPHSRELKNFVDVISGSCVNYRPKPLREEMEHELIPLAKRMAYGDKQTTHQMPEWMIAYFVDLKSKVTPWQSTQEVSAGASRESAEVLLDSDAESSAQASAALGSKSCQGSNEDKR